MLDIICILLIPQNCISKALEQHFTVVKHIKKINNWIEEWRMIVSKWFEQKLLPDKNKILHEIYPISERDKCLERDSWMWRCVRIRGWIIVSGLVYWVWNRNILPGKEYTLVYAIMHPEAFVCTRKQR